MPEERRVACFVHREFAYSRGVLRGLVQYARLQGNWRLKHFLKPFQTVVTMRHFDPAGIIGQFPSLRSAEIVGQLGLPTVNISSACMAVPVPQVTMDNKAVGGLAAQHLLERGLRHFAYASRMGAADYCPLREQGFAARLREAGVSYTRLPPLAPVPETDPALFRMQYHPGLYEFVRGLPRPVGILSVSDQLGANLCDIALQLGLRVPDDVAVLGVDNDELTCDLSLPPLSSVQTPGEQVGREAAALLDRLIDGAAPPARPMLLPPVCIAVRQSSDVLACPDAQVATALRYIRSRAAERISVEDVVRAVALNRRALEVRFRTALDSTIYKEIERAHIERAKTLLTQTRLPMSEVADRSGFSSPQWMAVTFRQHTGVTPTAWRRRSAAIQK